MREAFGIKLFFIADMAKLYLKTGEQICGM